MLSQVKRVGLWIILIMIALIVGHQLAIAGNKAGLPISS